MKESTNDDKRFHSLCTCRGKGSLHEMIKCFEVFVPIVRGNLKLLEQLSHDFVRRQSQQNIVYTEVRYSPHLLAEGGDFSGTQQVDADPVVDAVTRGLRRGETDFGVKVRQMNDKNCYTFMVLRISCSDVKNVSSCFLFMCCVTR